MKDGLLPFFIFLAIMLFSILRKGKKEGSSAPQRPHYVKTPPPPKVILPKPVALKKAVKRPVIAYEVEKKKTHPLLEKSWQDKGSLKQAFILSEVLKKVDEREFF